MVGRAATHRSDLTTSIFCELSQRGILRCFVKKTVRVRFAECHRARRVHTRLIWGRQRTLPICACTFEHRQYGQQRIVTLGCACAGFKGVAYSSGWSVRMQSSAQARRVVSVRRACAGRGRRRHTAHECDRYGLEQLLAQRVLELEHPAVMVARLEQR